jgi:hypothetical protein
VNEAGSVLLPRDPLQIGRSLVLLVGDGPVAEQVQAAYSAFLSEVESVALGNQCSYGTRSRGWFRREARIPSFRLRADRLGPCFLFARVRGGLLLGFIAGSPSQGPPMAGNPASG